MVKEGALLLLLIVNFSSKIDSKIYPSIQWNPRNPIFRTNHTLSVLPTSKLILVCPNIATILASVQNSITEDELHENIWLVDKGSYDSCLVNTKVKSNRLLYRCNYPSTLNFFPVVFQRVSSTVDGLEFVPGDDYYVIATSDGTMASINNTSGGHCKSANMRIKIHICTSGSDPRCDETKTTPAPETTTTQTTTEMKSTTQSSLPDSTTTRPSPKIITCQPPVQTSLPTVATDKGDHNNQSDTNDTLLQTTPGSNPVGDYSKGQKPCDYLKYELSIALLSLLVFLLSLPAVYLYLNTHHNLIVQWPNRRKMPSVTFSTKRTPNLERNSCTSCFFENKNAERGTSLK